MRQLRGAKRAPDTDLMSIEHVADTWEVGAKTVANWANIIYLAFDIRLPKSGPFPMWAVSLLEICAKHISQKAGLYYAETQESRRLKGLEFIRKMRHLRKEGHFAEFDQFRSLPDSFEDEAELDDDIETLSELGELAAKQDSQLHSAKAFFEQREDEQIEELADFIGDTDKRRMGKLANRLKHRRIASVLEAQILEGA